MRRIQLDIRDAAGLEELRVDRRFMAIRWALAYLGCIFLAADLLYVHDVGAALPFIGVLGLCSSAFAIRDAFGASDAESGAQPWIRLGLAIVVGCTLVGAIASTLPSLQILDDDGTPRAAFAISRVAAPALFATVCGFAVRALARPSARRLAQLGIASTFAWPALHFCYFVAQFSLFSDLVIADPPAVLAFTIAVYGIALVGVLLGIVSVYVRSEATLVRAIALPRRR